MSIHESIQRRSSYFEAPPIFDSIDMNITIVTKANLLLKTAKGGSQQQVKSEFCYGAQNFVVAYNQDDILEVLGP